MREWNKRSILHNFKLGGGFSIGLRAHLTLFAFLFISFLSSAPCTMMCCMKRNNSRNCYVLQTMTSRQAKRRRCGVSAARKKRTKHKTIFHISHLFCGLTITKFPPFASRWCSALVIFIIISMLRLSLRVSQSQSSRRGNAIQRQKYKRSHDSLSKHHAELIRSFRHNTRPSTTSSPCPTLCHGWTKPCERARRANITRKVKVLLFANSQADNVS